MGLVVAVAQLARIGAVGVGRVHRRADREAGDEPPARDAVDHGELLGHARRRIVEGEAVAQHADRRIGGAPGQRRGDQVRRRHQAVAVRVMLVAADGVEAALGRVLELVEELVVHVMRAPGVEQRGVDVDPDRRVLVLEIVGQLLVGHQVKPQEFHGSSSRPRRGSRPLLEPCRPYGRRSYSSFSMANARGGSRTMSQAGPRHHDERFNIALNSAQARRRASSAAGEAAPMLKYPWIIPGSRKYATRTPARCSALA